MPDRARATYGKAPDRMAAGQEAPDRAPAGDRKAPDRSRAARGPASGGPSVRAAGGAPPRTAGGRPRRSGPGRRTLDERPAAPWGGFPLSELLVLAGLVLMGWGLLSWDGGGNRRFAAGLALAALAGLELSLREHLAGYRSHTTLLAGVGAFLVVTALALGPGPHALPVLLAIAAAVFVVALVALRELFKRRSGGLPFR